MCRVSAYALEVTLSGFDSEILLFRCCALLGCLTLSKSTEPKRIETNLSMGFICIRKEPMIIDCIQDYHFSVFFVDI